MALKAIVLTCWEICLLRQSPQVFPRSGILLGMMLLVYTLLDIYSGFLNGLYDWLDLLGSTLVDVAMLTLFCYLVMYCWHKRVRFKQTLTAMLGTGSLITCASLPLLSVLHFQTMPPTLQELITLMLLILLLWNIVVMAHILRHALDHAVFAPILLAAPYQLLNFLVLLKLFPGN